MNDSSVCVLNTRINEGTGNTVRTKVPTQNIKVMDLEHDPVYHARHDVLTQITIGNIWQDTEIQ